MPRLHRFSRHLWGSKRSFPVEGISQFSDPGSGSTGMYLACSNFNAKFQQFLVCGNWIVEACWIQGQHEHHCRVLAPLCCCNEGTYRCLWHHMAQYGPIWLSMAQYGTWCRVMCFFFAYLCFEFLDVVVASIFQKHLCQDEQVRKKHEEDFLSIGASPYLPVFFSQTCCFSDLRSWLNWSEIRKKLGPRCMAHHSTSCIIAHSGIAISVMLLSLRW